MLTSDTSRPWRHRRSMTSGRIRTSCADCCCCCGGDRTGRPDQDAAAAAAAAAGSCCGGGGGIVNLPPPRAWGTKEARVIMLCEL